MLPRASLGVVLLVLACGDAGTTASTTADTTGTTDADPTGSTAPATSVDVPTTSTSTTADTTADLTDSAGSTAAAGPPEVRLPQAIAGAMMADPTTYPTLPLHLAVAGAVDQVSVQLDDGPALDAAAGGPTWLAQLPVAGLAEGPHTLTATATGPGGSAQATAELVLGTTGVQWTDIAVDGNAGTPALHRRPGEDLLWLTWADGSEADKRRGWLEPIDGAGRSAGPRVALTPASDDAPYARAALGQTAVAVLYQLPGGGPYFNRLRVVDLMGAELLAPVALEPPGGFGSFGGDIQYDGAGFVATFRANDGMGGGAVGWLRVDEATLELTGPVEVAASGDGAPDGGFDPFSLVTLAALDDTRSVLTFVRERHNGPLDLLLPKAQLAALDPGGTIAGPDFIASGSDFQWHWEARVRPAGDQLLLLWTTDDLNDPSPTIPTAIRGALVDPASAVGHDEGAGAVLVQAPETRGEPFFVATDEARGILVWTDQRSYVDLQTGKIELMATRLVDDALAVDVEDTLTHARFIAGTAHFGGAAAGTNAVVAWIDERHGGSILDPRPEVYLDTIWR